MIAPRFLKSDAMPPALNHLSTILSDLLACEDVVKKAHAENYRFEERVGDERRRQYEAEHGPGGATHEEWLKSHEAYLWDAVYLDSPETPDTFLTINEAAQVDPAVWGPRGEKQELVRIEALDFALTHTTIGSVDRVQELLGIHNGDIQCDEVRQTEAKALLEKLCDSLNRNPNARRPRFAAFAEELSGDIGQTDWAERLRDRLGLAHLPPKEKFGPYPVALMRYTVEEVVKRAKKLDASIPLSVPTVLDSEPYEVFHPAPRQAPYGRTLNLAGDEADNDLISEVLHPRIDYRPKHLWKVGVIINRRDLSPERLAELRGNHISLLRRSTGRDDFGMV